jgi:two-component system chemotaxis sensor kinase CheA
MNELLAQFILEARDLLREAGEDLLALERKPDDVEAINRLFRSVHTLKGSSGLFEAQPLTQVLHAAEDIFQAVRELGLRLTPDMVDLALKVFDQVGSWIEQLDQNEALSDEAAPVAAALVIELRSCFGRRPGEPLAKPDVAPAPEPARTPIDLARWFPDDVLAKAAAAAADDGVTLISYLPEEGCFFRGEDPLHLAMQLPGLQALWAEARTDPAALRDFDPFACTLDFHALSTAGRAELDALFRYVPDQVTITELSVVALKRSSLGTAPAPVLTLLREQIDLLSLEAPDGEFMGRVVSAARVAANALAFAGRIDASAILANACAEALSARATGPLIAAIDAFVQIEPQPLASGGDADPPPELIALGAVVEAGERTPPRTLRVDQEKVDALLDLVGELVVAKNGLPYLARRAEQEHGLRDLGRGIRDQFGVIDRIAQDLQSAVMSVRMMPVGQVFQRFPRLVRDLSRKLGKEVELVIEGEATEADKNVVESLFDPILHMVRNSLDHGVETPEVRAACGKSAMATVKLTARHDGDQVVIEVVDDGRGIDPEVIKRKAYERGLLDEARLAAISDQDAIMLVFAAGFSTAEAVSDVSGRGVGMDVVRSTVEKAGGRISMRSAKGLGTTVTLNLPLSMAVSRVMTVALDDRLFGIPMELIHGTVKIPCGDIVSIKGREAFVLRDRVVPLLRLARLLDLPPEAVRADEVPVLVTRVDAETVGLGISAFGEVMEVILKPLEGMLAKIVGYSGTALLGDGRVLLVLDLKELIR